MYNIPFLPFLFKYLKLLNLLLAHVPCRSKLDHKLNQQANVWQTGLILLQSDATWNIGNTESGGYIVTSSNKIACSVLGQEACDSIYIF